MTTIAQEPINTKVVTAFTERLLHALIDAGFLKSSILQTVRLYRQYTCYSFIADNLLLQIHFDAFRDTFKCLLLDDHHALWQIEHSRNQGWSYLTDLEPANGHNQEYRGNTPPDPEDIISHLEHGLSHSGKAG